MSSNSRKSQTDEACERAAKLHTIIESAMTDFTEQLHCKEKNKYSSIMTRNKKKIIRTVTIPQSIGFFKEVMCRMEWRRWGMNRWW